MSEYGESVRWQPERPRFRLSRLLISWALTAISLWAAARLLPGVDVVDTGGAFAMAAVVAIINAVIPPLLAALRLPFMLALGFILVLIANAIALQIGSDILDSFQVDNFGWALLAALVVGAVSVILEVIFSTNDDDTYTLRVVQRIAKRQGGATRTDVPGIVFLEIDGLALPVLRRAMRDGSAPHMAKWLAEGSHRLMEWEPDLSSQTGASQAGILLGTNHDIPAFRWVEKETGTVRACSAPADCALIEKERATGIGLLDRRGHEPRQPALRRGRGRDPDRQPHRGGEAREPRLPRVLRERVQRHALARALLLGARDRVDGGDPGSPTRRASPRPPQRRVPVHARGDVRDRARPDRLRRADRSDARPPGDLRDVLELRRGRAPQRSRAHGHAGGAPQARPAIRADRPCAPVRAEAVRDRRALRPRTDAGRDVQAAKRVRARRARRALGRGRRRRRDRRR